MRHTFLGLVTILALTVVPSAVVLALLTGG
jgi:hypothetical protein